MVDASLGIGRPDVNRWFGYAALTGGVLVCGYTFALYKARQPGPEVGDGETSSMTIATDPAAATAVAPLLPAPLVPEPAAAEPPLPDVSSATVSAATTDG
jgi:hypothetical protein